MAGEPLVVPTPPPARHRRLAVSWSL